MDTLQVKIRHTDGKKYWSICHKGLKSDHTKNCHRLSMKILIVTWGRRRRLAGHRQDARSPNKHERMFNIPNRHRNQTERTIIDYFHPSNWQDIQKQGNIKYWQSRETIWWSQEITGCNRAMASGWQCFTVSWIFFFF